MVGRALRCICKRAPGGDFIAIDRIDRPVALPPGCGCGCDCGRCRGAPADAAAAATSVTAAAAPSSAAYAVATAGGGGCTSTAEEAADVTAIFVGCSQPQERTKISHQPHGCWSFSRNQLKIWCIK